MVRGAGRQRGGVRRLCPCRVGASEAGPASGLLQVSLSVQSSCPHRWPSTRPQATPRGRRFPQASSGQAASSDLRTDVLTPPPRMASFGNRVSAAGIT